MAKRWRLNGTVSDLFQPACPLCKLAESTPRPTLNSFTLSVCGVDYSLTSRTRWRWPFWRRLDDRRAFEIVRIRPQMAEMTPYLRLMKSRDVIHTYANRFIASVPTRVTCSLSRKFGPGGTHGHDVPYLILPRARRAPTLPLDPTGGKALRPPYRLALPRSP
jgi:hypothetical protein